jgi:hypothetical protein
MGVADASLDAGAEDAASEVDACALSCGAGCCGAAERCTSEGACLSDLGPCDGDGACLDDSYCFEGRCAPYGTGPRGGRHELCRRAVLPGRFAPAIQCRWSGPGAGDPLPAFREVESTALVVDFGIGRGPDEPVRPSIVFISADAFAYGDRGVLRVIDGRTCADQAVLAAPEDRVGAATTPAVGDLDGDGRAEIVAKSGEGGLVAFAWDPGTSTFVRRWFSHDASGARDRSFGAEAIPSLSMADLDDDGVTEILMGAVVYAADGTLLDAAEGLGYRASDGPARQAPPQRPSHAPRVCSLGTVCVQPSGTSCSVAVVTDSNAPRSVLWRADVAPTSASLVASCASVPPSRFSWCRPSAGPARRRPPPRAVPGV